MTLTPISAVAARCNGCMTLIEFGGECPVCKRAAKQLALEAAVRELLEACKKLDGENFYDVREDRIDNLRKAYKELSE